MGLVQNIFKPISIGTCIVYKSKQYIVRGIMQDRGSEWVLVDFESKGWGWYDAEKAVPDSQQKFEKSDDLKSDRKVSWQFVEREQIVFTDEIVDESFSNIVNEINDELYDR